MSEDSDSDSEWNESEVENDETDEEDVDGEFVGDEKFSKYEKIQIVEHFKGNNLKITIQNIDSLFNKKKHIKRRFGSYFKSRFPHRTDVVCRQLFRNMIRQWANTRKHN